MLRHPTNQHPLRWSLSGDRVMRTALRLNRNVHRAIAKLFVPGKEIRRGYSRAHAVMARILTLDEPRSRTWPPTWRPATAPGITTYETEVTEHLAADRRALI